jgi:hypothetical protein
VDLFAITDYSARPADGARQCCRRPGPADRLVQGLPASGRTRSRRDARLYGALVLFDRSHSTHRRHVVLEIRKSVERGPAFYRRAQREWIERLRRAAAGVAQRLVAGPADPALPSRRRVQAQWQVERRGGGPERLVLGLS